MEKRLSASQQHCVVQSRALEKRATKSETQYNYHLKNRHLCVHFRNCYPKQKVTHLLESQNSQRGVPQLCIVLKQSRFKILSSDLLSIHIN